MVSNIQISIFVVVLLACAAAAAEEEDASSSPSLTIVAHYPASSQQVRLRIASPHISVINI